MPILGQVVTGGKSRERINANNKIKIPDGTRPAEIIDVWIFNVDAEGRYTREKTGEQKAAIKIRFDKRADIVLEKRMRCYISEKAAFAILLSKLTGLAPGSSEMRQYDTDHLVGKKVLVTTNYSDPYTNITDIVPAVSADDDFDTVPPQTLAEVDRRNALPKTEVQKAADSYEAASWPSDDEIPF